MPPRKAGRKRSRPIFTRQRQIIHALLPQMIQRWWGRIINMTGKSEPDRPAFSAKAAVQAWAKGLSREIGEYGIQSTQSRQGGS
jgi:3-oxoacyl-[acyl-carrier protein] reductase